MKSGLGRTLSGSDPGRLHFWTMGDEQSGSGRTRHRGWRL